MNKIGLREFRNSLGITLADMAKSLDCSISWLSKVETKQEAFSDEYIKRFNAVYPNANINWDEETVSRVEKYKERITQLEESIEVMNDFYKAALGINEAQQKVIEGIVKLIEGTHYVVPYRRKRVIK